MTDEQQWLPFDFVIREQIAKELPLYKSPQCDNERLLNLQYEYRVNGNKKALGEMYQIGKSIAAKYITIMAQENKKIKKLSYEQRQEFAHQAVTYIISAYLRKPDWSIKTSWTAYLWLATKKQLLGYRKVDKIVNFIDMNRLYKNADDGMERDNDEQFKQIQSQQKTERKVKIYISGKITGDKDWREKFTSAEKKLKSEYMVLSPAHITSVLDYEDYMHIDFAMIDCADAIFMLRDWEDSAGARRELTYAKSHQKEVIYEGAN